VGFELLVGYGEHGDISCECLFGVNGRETENLGKEVFRRVCGVFRGQRNTELDSMWLM